MIEFYLQQNISPQQLERAMSLHLNLYPAGVRAVMIGNHEEPHSTHTGTHLEMYMRRFVGAYPLQVRCKTYRQLKQFYYADTREWMVLAAILGDVLLVRNEKQLTQKPKDATAWAGILYHQDGTMDTLSFYTWHINNQNHIDLF